jgi:hypothetical protein
MAVYAAVHRKFPCVDAVTTVSVPLEVIGGGIQNVPRSPPISVLYTPHHSVVVSHCAPRSCKSFPGASKGSPRRPTHSDHCIPKCRGRESMLLEPDLWHHRHSSCGDTHLARARHKSGHAAACMDTCVYATRPMRQFPIHECDDHQSSPLVPLRVIKNTTHHIRVTLHTERTIHHHKRRIVLSIRGRRNASMPRGASRHPPRPVLRCHVPYKRVSVGHHIRLLREIDYN